MVRKMGKPDLFVTVTCNPKWVEIQRELNGAAATTRPDLLARVFKLKLECILEDILERGVLGKVKVCHSPAIAIFARKCHQHLLIDARSY